MTFEKKKLVTYTLPRPFFKVNIPIPIQSAYLRDYATRNGLVFTLPTTEVCFEKSYYALGNLLRQLTNEDHFAAVSILALPLEDPVIFDKLKKLVEGRGSITFHFPLEGFVGTIQKVMAWREDFLFMRRSSSKSTNKGF